MKYINLAKVKVGKGYRMGSMSPLENTVRFITLAIVVSQMPTEYPMIWAVCDLLKKIEIKKAIEISARPQPIITRSKKIMFVFKKKAISNTSKPKKMKDKAVIM